MKTLPNELFSFSPAKDWAGSLSDTEIINLLKNNDFANEQLDAGRDYCYFLHKVERFDKDSRQYYTLMAYTLNEPGNLEYASMNDVLLDENEFFNIHRISVFRNGQLIDKTPQTTIKILDNETQNGVISNEKKLNVSIKDLHLGDILILEDTREKIYTEKEFLRRDFLKTLLHSADPYWAYGSFRYKFINERETPVAYKNCFFRDENQQVIPSEVKILQKGESFEVHKENFINFYDNQRQLNSFIDFATDADWKAISNYIYPMYQEALGKADLKTFAPDLAEKLDKMTDLEAKIRYAIEFVGNHIYYLYNADEMNGHKPQEPALTYQNKQGDCKAKTVLLKSILDYLGVDSAMILVNYNADFWIKYYLPSPLNFNHIILKINHKGEEFFIDPVSRNNFGFLENRSQPIFCHYLELNENQELKERKGFRYKNYGIEERISLEAKENVGKFSSDVIYRYHRADNMRNQFKNKKKHELVDSWNDAFFHNLNYQNDRKGKDFRQVFKNANLELISDDKDKNEVRVRYTAEIENPYFKNTEGKEFLMYFDWSYVNGQLLNYQHDDASFWVNTDSQYYEIFLSTDRKIDTKEKYTCQECDIQGKYLTHKTQKFITKNSGKMIIEHRPMTNVEIPLDEFEDARKDWNTLADSNFGLGIDIVEEKGFFGKLKGIFG